MKTHAPLFLLIVAAFGGALWFSASLFAIEKSGPSRNVVINEKGIVIPGTELSKADNEAMNRILNQYDKTLYRINTYENGKLKKMRGKLTDVVTDKQFASQIAANLKSAGFAQHTVRVHIGDTTNPTDTAPVVGFDNNPTTTAPLAGFSTDPTNTAPVAGFDDNPTNTAPLAGFSTDPTNTAAVAGFDNNPTNTSNAGKPTSYEVVSRLKQILEKYRSK